jgi:hypothetical protein
LLEISYFCTENPHLSDNLQRYLPEYDDDETRTKLAGFSRDELMDMLVRSYRVTRVVAKMLDEQYEKQRRIQAVMEEPSKLSQMPDVPGPDDLKKMME